MCNLGSVRRAFQECGAEVIVSSNPLDLEQATHIVLPGVGAFSSGMEKLKKLEAKKKESETLSSKSAQTETLEPLDQLT